MKHPLIITWDSQCSVVLPIGLKSTYQHAQQRRIYSVKKSYKKHVYTSKTFDILTVENV